MRKVLITAVSAAALAAPLPALAEEVPKPAEEESRTAQMAKNFADPERQRDMALMMRAMAEVMLDMPVAPMVEAMENATGEAGPKVAPNATLRSMSPDVASKMPELIEKGVPAAMSAMGAAADGAAKMTPAMREMAAKMAPVLEAMAAKMKDVVPQGD